MAQLGVDLDYDGANDCSAYHLGAKVICQRLYMPSRCHTQMFDNHGLCMLAKSHFRSNAKSSSEPESRGANVN